MGWCCSKINSKFDFVLGLIGVFLSCPGWQLFDWYFDGKATGEYVCIGKWYRPLGLANWFITPGILLITFYIFFDLDHTISHRKWGLMGLGYFSMEKYGGDALLSLFQINPKRKWGKLRCISFVLWFPFMVLVNFVWLIIFNYIILWFASWHEWIMGLDGMCENVCGEGFCCVSDTERRNFEGEDGVVEDGKGQNYNLLSKWFPIKRNRWPLWKIHAVPEKLIQISMAFYCFYSSSQTPECADDDAWQILASGIGGLFMLLVTVYQFIRLLRAVYCR